MVQILQGRHSHAGLSDRHPRAHDRIQHPGGNHSDQTRCNLDMNEFTARTALTILLPNAAAVQRMPRIMDDDFRPDMGRMTQQWLYPERTRYSLAAMRVEQIGRPSRRWSKPAN